MKTLNIALLILLCAFYIGHSQNLNEESFEVRKSEPIKITSEFIYEDALTFDLPNNETVIAQHYFTDNHSNGSNCWVGKINAYEHGYAIICETNDIIFGKIETNLGEIFKIKPNAAGKYQLDWLDYSPVKEDCYDMINIPTDEDIEETHEHGHNHHPENSSSAAGDVCAAPISCGLNQQVDVLVFFTPSASTNMGGNVASVSAIAMAITEANLINTNSNVDHSFSLARAELISYTESGSFSTDLNRLRSPNDGFIDQIHTIRNQYYADLVAIVAGSGGCGIGNLNADNLQYDAQSAYSVVSNGCMTGNKSLSHEMGHNLGLRHDRFAYTNGGGSLPNVVCSWGWGWTNPDAQTGTLAERWYTTMAYDDQCDDWGVNCSRINHWSNPNVTVAGDATGSAIGNSDEAHNEYVLDRAVCQVIDFKVSPCDTCVIYTQCENYSSATSSGPGNTTTITINGSFSTANPSGPNPQVCVYYYGDNNNSSETFDVDDENGNFLGTTVAGFDCDLPTRVCFSVTTATYNSWIGDNIITVTLDPTSTQINPNLCTYGNYACAEIVLSDTSAGCSTEVTSTLGSGPGSLREAVNCAVAGDTITFATALNNMTIESELPVINLNKLLYFRANAGQNITLSNQLISNTGVLFSITDDLHVLGLRIVGKSEDSMILEVGTTGSLNIQEGDLDKVDIRN